MKVTVFELQLSYSGENLVSWGQFISGLRLFCFEFLSFAVDLDLELLKYCFSCEFRVDLNCWIFLGKCSVLCILWLYCFSLYVYLLFCLIKVCIWSPSNVVQKFCIISVSWNIFPFFLYSLLIFWLSTADMGLVKNAILLLFLYKSYFICVCLWENMFLDIKLLF